MVPGCSGLGRRGHYYCYEASLDPGPSVGPPLRNVLFCPIGGCGECQGPCDVDGDCVEGLNCFRRNGLERVTGCRGSGESGVGYCFRDPQVRMPPVSNDPPLLFVPPCPAFAVCGRCQGGCRSDNNCDAGLICFHRASFEAVPGCSGLGISGINYCFSTSIEPTPTLAPNTVPGIPSAELAVVNIGQCLRDDPCGECEGYCEDDSECAEGLRCFSRRHLEPIAGCRGVGTWGRNYCFADPSLAPAPATPTEAPPLQVLHQPCSPTLPCGICEGHCRNDNDCQADFKCFARGGFELVPGCSGLGRRGHYYCYEASLDPGPSMGPPLTTPGSCRIGGCGECQGPCEVDGDCVEGLSCFRRDGLERVAGCRGSGESGVGYCFRDPQVRMPPPSNDPPLVFVDERCASRSLLYFACGQCQGGCEEDDDCDAGLSCFYRGSFEAVPGCGGLGVRGMNYCFSTSVVEPSPAIAPSTVPGPPSVGTLLLAIGQCTRENPCGECEGYCEDDSECAEGLRCYRKDLGPIPGCSGSGAWNRGYCFADPSLVPAPPPTAGPPLQVASEPCSFASLCGVCQGHCRRDTDCQANLKCLARGGFELVPGCSGLGRRGHYYCYEASLEPDPPVGGPALTITACLSAGACGECQGSCNVDAQCAGGLSCFQRRGLERIPGCSGLGTSGAGYCFRDPQVRIPPPPLDDPPLSSLLAGSTCLSSSPCGQCQGPCVEDEECGDTGLSCFDRGSFEQVPGCSGLGISGMNYCSIDSS